MRTVSAIVAALRAQAAAARASADLLEAAAFAIESPEGGDTLVTRANWDGPPTFRTLLDAAVRGELPKVKAGRTPAFRRGDVEAWLMTRTTGARVASRESTETRKAPDDYAQAVADESKRPVRRRRP